MILVLACSASVNAQIPSADDDDVRSWNELHLEIPLNDKLLLLLQGTARFDRNISRFGEGRLAGGIAWNLNKALTVSPLYQYIEVRNSAGRFTTEHRYNLKGTYKFPFKKIGLSHGSHYEYRVRSSGNQWRYRPSITIEKALPEKFLGKTKVYVTEEPFYVSTTRKFSRNRLSFGISKTFNERFTLDLYYLRQDDSRSQPGLLHVLGTKWKIRL
jgi:hypothetical protein